MKSRYEAYVDGIALSSIHPNLMILDIGHITSDADEKTQQIANRDGYQLLSDRRTGTAVTISVQLRIYNIAERQKIIQELQSWASGTILETNDRPGQYLRAKCSKFPMASSAMNWLETLYIVFSSYEQPFWQEKTPSSITLTGATGSGNLFVPGNIGKALVEVEVTPSASISTITLTVGSTQIVLTGVNSSSKITITYDSRNIQSIKCGTSSILNKRSGSDDLLAECGKITPVSYSASASCSVKFSAKGMWL